MNNKKNKINRNITKLKSNLKKKFYLLSFLYRQGHNSSIKKKIQLHLSNYRFTNNNNNNN